MKNSSTLALIGGFGFVGRNILENIATNPDFDGLSPVVIDNLSNPAPGHDDLDVPSFVGNYEDAGALEFLDGLEESGEGRVFVFLAGETRVAESKDRPLDFIDANIADPARFVMQAVKPGDKFIINGSKTFISNGQNADVVIVVAKTDPSLGAKGTSLGSVLAQTKPSAP